MANNPSSSANSNDMYPHSGIYGRILPSGYAHFADDSQNQKNRGNLPYITTFPSGWDENVAAKERYGNLDDLQNAHEVFFPVYTSGIRFTSALSVYTVTPDSTPGTMSKLFASSGGFSNSETVYDQAASGKFYFDASGFKNQGSVLARSGESFMFTNSFAANTTGGFNLRGATSPFQYKVQYSVVSDFNSVIYRYRTPVNSIASGVYVYPPAPSPPTLPAPPPSEPPSPPPDGPPLEEFPEFLLTIDPDWAIKIKN